MSTHHSNAPAATRLRFAHDQDFVELELLSPDTAEMPGQREVYLSIRVSSAGFSGHNDLWIQGPALQAFCQALANLERNRRGRACLDSLMPNELQLQVRAIDSVGHVGIEGSTGFDVPRRGLASWHSVQFAFEFDPAQLVDALSVEWVRRHADGAN